MNRPRTMHGALAALLLLSPGCDYLHLQSMKQVRPDDWPMDGGSIGRTNLAHSVVAPPLELAWQYDASAGFGAAAAVAAESVLFVSNLQGEVHAISILTGKSLGKFDFGSALAGAPVLDGDMLYVALAHDEESLVAYNLASGKSIWTASLGDIDSSPLLIGTKVVAANSQGTLTCVDKNTGKTDWTYEMVRGRRVRPVTVRSSPASDGRVIVMCGDDGSLCAAGVQDGKEAWRASVPGAIVATPSIRDGLLLVGSLDSLFHAFDIATGRKLWSCRLGGRIYASHAAGPEYAYVVTAGKTLHCVDIRDGRIAWSVRSPDLVNSAPILSGGTLYAGSLDKGLYAFDALTGRVLWRFPADGRIKTSPLAHRGYLFACTEEHSVLAFLPEQRPAGK